MQLLLLQLYDLVAHYADDVGLLAGVVGVNDGSVAVGGEVVAADAGAIDDDADVVAAAVVALVDPGSVQLGLYGASNFAR